MGQHPGQHEEGAVTMEEAISVDFVTLSRSPGQREAGQAALSGVGCMAGRADSSNSDELQAIPRNQAQQSLRGMCSCEGSSSSRKASAIDSHSAYSPVIHGVKGFADSRISNKGHLWAQRKQRRHRGGSRSQLQQSHWEHSSSRWSSNSLPTTAAARHSLCRIFGAE